ncbi:MAG: SDR family NAD(P)-dependent oxidoreductase, partial [Anaerolineales bacterium]|nr:SDR family NAD(P)-dependent oxidoreductase [Anaerolineales bacterium]
MEQSLQGNIFLVTGATSGIGWAIATELAHRGATLFGVGRSAERCAACEAKLRSQGGQVRFLTADLSLQSEIRRLTEQVAALTDRVDVLINNAAVFTWKREETAEGFEMQWAVNHLAPFALTLRLWPLLRNASAARVVTVSSNSHYHTRLRWQDIQLRRGYNGLLAYKQTKLCNVLFTVELDRRFRAMSSSARAFAADPGLVVTDMGFKHTPWWVQQIWAWRRRGGISPQESARGIVFLATDPNLQMTTELYWKHGRPKAPNPLALDPQAAYRLWQLSLTMCQLEDP